MRGEAESPLSIRLAHPDDAPLVADILADAFREDPVMSWMTGGVGRRRPLFFELARRIYLKRGFGHIAGEEAATLWLPALAHARPAFWDELSIAYAILGMAGLAALARSKRVGDIMANHHPPTAHYYLFAVGVRDGGRGKGLGGGVIREGLKRADAERSIAYLENSNPKNTALYQRLGFEAQSPLPLPAGAPPLLAMLRAPSAETAA